MTSAQINADIFHSLSVIAEEETLMKRAAKYLKQLADRKQEEETLMTKDKFFFKIDHALEEAERGEGIRFTNKENMNAWLNTL